MSTSKKAKTILFNESGGPEVLKIENVDILPPAAHEVRLQVKAIGLNRIDAMFRMGFFEKAIFPSKIGFEASGIIESIGSDVKNLSVGDKVSVVPSFSNRDYGTYGELILVPAYAIQRYHENLSFEEAASLWTSHIAIYGMLVDIANLRTGQAVVINAASSNTGLAAIQITNMLGGISVALTSTSKKKQALLDAGAQHVIVTGEQDVPAEVLAVTDGKGGDIILDAVGGSQFATLVASAAQRAQYFAYGMLSMESGVYPGLAVASKLMTIRGYDMSDVVMNPEKSHAAIRFVQDGVASGALRPVVDKTFPLDDVVAAHRYLEGNQQIGKVVLVP